MKITRKHIEIYQDCNGKEPFSEWIVSLAVRDRARILVRIDRVEMGNRGDYRSVGEDMYELRFYFGPGYRVYYGEIENRVLLLCGGDKSSQKDDVKKAKAYWREFRGVI